MTVIVREFRPETDADGWARTRLAALPYMLTTPEQIVHDAARSHPDARFRPLVAEVDGEVVGTAQVSLAHEASEPGQGLLNVYVHPEHTGRGAGSLLTHTGEEYLAGLGAAAVYTWVLDERPYRTFAERRGYTASRSAHFLHLDLTGPALPAPPALPPGVELCTAADFADDPRRLFAADAATVADEPGDVDALLDDYEDWLATTWHHPLTSRELTTVAVVDGEVAAFTLARTDGATRYSTGMTGTLREFRGRGLAKLVKAHALHRARAAGLVDAYTGNDTENEAMLAVNRWCGYRVAATEVRHVRELG
ncbi:GNAT family N-acetyltransferase [Streptomyces sp. NPDC050504]|uniref:GNAT family N-acetyltransferase n=1 Tax=Streptomyces sp. NPDC050504 TaxID=3365618 RepID=UPI0037A641D3